MSYQKKETFVKKPISVPPSERSYQNSVVLLNKATIIEMLKTLEGLKRKLQLILKTY